MTSRRPLIGITPSYEDDIKRIFLSNYYAESVDKAGGLPIILPLTEDLGVISQIAKTCDGILVSGGPDMDAVYYNEDNMPYNGNISPLRDKLEVALVREVFKLKKPILGICRGMQVLNVALGGTLYQDVYSQIKDRDIIKHRQEAPRWYPTHEISIVSNSIVWHSFSCDTIRVNSFHHQAVKDVAPGFKVTSTTNDGIIESIEFEGDTFVVGVQWHPENMWKKDPIYLRIFELFVESIKRRSGNANQTAPW
ncbi:MAG TPA: gamma-glutamyl-gamma-aminobutyrate hydrolase family protein [Clostridiaceae bacterium]|nr:gamma-glutamyl-gamma-aminobutyrate hydrolase family protein [Clostridiaceae bacterium]